MEDFANRLAGISASYLQSNAGVYGVGQHWTAGVMAEHYQLTDYTLTNDNLPYSRLPRAYLNWEQPLGHWLDAGVWAEAVRFEHRERAGGTRLDVKPYLTARLAGPAWYITPTLAWRHTAYQLDHQLAQQLGGGNSPSRSLPITTLDAGVYFDRDTTIDGQAYLHTLEPRLFYLNAPYREQDGLPLFDTRPFTFSWGQLFRDNRYSGADRQTDANQLTVALSTRLIRQADGREKLSASLGQIRYFEDSRVVAPGETPVAEGKSAWVADAKSRPLLNALGAQLMAALPEDPEKKILDQFQNPSIDDGTAVPDGDDSPPPADDAAPGDGAYRQGEQNGLNQLIQSTTAPKP